MFIDNKPYGIIAVCDCCKVPIDDDTFDFRNKWVNHLHPECIYEMIDKDGNFPDHPIYFNHEYKENWEQLMSSQFGYDDDYYDDDWSVDEWSMHNDDIKHYNQLEIDDMYAKHYHFSWWIGKNIMNTDSYWFTSDELEAFSVIWQRRISAV